MLIADFFFFLEKSILDLEKNNLHIITNNRDVYHQEVFEKKQATEPQGLIKVLIRKKVDHPH